MTREQLCIALALPDNAGVHEVRSRVARIASGKPELGSTPAKRAALVAALRLQPGCGDVAILRVVESILRPHPLSAVPSYRRGQLRIGKVDARGARTI